MQIFQSQLEQFAKAGATSVTTFAVYDSEAEGGPGTVVLETLDADEAICFADGRRVTRRKNNLVWAGGLRALCAVEEVPIASKL